MDFGIAIWSVLNVGALEDGRTALMDADGGLGDFMQVIRDMLEEVWIFKQRVRSVHARASSDIVIYT